MDLQMISLCASEGTTTPTEAFKDIWDQRAMCPMTQNVFLDFSMLLLCPPWLRLLCMTRGSFSTLAVPLLQAETGTIVKVSWGELSRTCPSASFSTLRRPSFRGLALTRATDTSSRPAANQYSGSRSGVLSLASQNMNLNGQSPSQMAGSIQHPSSHLPLSYISYTAQPASPSHPPPTSSHLDASLYNSGYGIASLPFNSTAGGTSGLRYDAIRTCPNEAVLDWLGRRRDSTVLG
jgi:hypothetical protein